MARIIPGFGVAGVKGKIGNSIFQTSRFGVTIKENSKRSQSNTPLQMEQRSFLPYLFKVWSSLTSSQRTQWQTYSEFYKSFPTNGQTTRLDGYHVFLELGMNCLQVGVPIHYDPRWISSVPHLNFSGVSGGVETMNIICLNVIDWTDNVSLVRCTPPLSLTTNSPGKRFTFVESEVIDNYTVSLYDGFVARFGSAQPSLSKVFFKYVIINKTSMYRSNAVEGYFETSI
jgi:hypothetical protein